MRGVGRVAILTGALLLVCGCQGPGSAGPGTDAGAAPPEAAPSAAPPVRAGGAAEPASCPYGGRLIPAVTIPAVHADPVHIPARTVGGERIPAATVPGVDIPAQRVPAQCVEVRPAPGGCLSAVSIPSVTIPETRIPPVQIPGVRAGGITLEPVRAGEQVAQAQTAQAQSTGEVCQVEPREGGLVPSVLRPSLLRPSVLRPSVLRPSLLRPSACNGGGECVPSVHVPSVTVPSVMVPSVTVPSAQLRTRTVGRSEVLEGEGTIAYSIDTDVLFDFDKAGIRPQAAAELRKVTDEIGRSVPAGARIQVDGHTDGKGDSAYNQRLSERRARAVVDWLATEGGVERSRLAAAGYGETKPAARGAKGGAGDPAGRAKDRRVVISARRG